MFSTFYRSGKLEFREVKQIAQRHSAGEWLSPNVYSDGTNPESFLPMLTLSCLLCGAGGQNADQLKSTNNVGTISLYLVQGKLNPVKTEQPFQFSNTYLLRPGTFQFGGEVE